MLLKRIKLRNFRQFIGEQVITFSTNAIKNVTVIMGENDSGKTTLAQAFTWCLYGDTDFQDKAVLCKAIALKMRPGTEETVRVELDLIHSGTDYSITREQKYTKDSAGNMKRPGQTVFGISYKGTDGQREYVRDLDTEIRMKEILPKELSKYFFFDGERIGNMSKEISRGKSQEFAAAVRSLLGLSAFTAALDHLKGNTSKLSVLRLYNQSYDSLSDSKIVQYTHESERYEREIERIDQRLSEIDNEQLIANEKCIELTERIALNARSSELAQRKKDLLQRRDALALAKATNAASMLKLFNSSAPSYFAIKLMQDALTMLAETDRIDKGIPDIHARTIEFLVKRGTCLCGAEIRFGNPAHKELTKVLEYIPPHSIGALISQLVRECELKCNAGMSLYDDTCQKYSIIRDFENSYGEIMQDISSIEDRLEGMDNIGILQRDLKKYERALADLSTERDSLNQQRGRAETSLNRAETERNALTLKDAANRKIEVYKAYAQCMHDLLKQEYESQEDITRTELAKTVNEIFQSIFDGDFSILLDEKYNIQVVVNSGDYYVEDVEAGTAKSTSVIFAFIAGVIKMARRSKNPENEMLVAEPYPLVMDAPLSAFDKTRIKSVCDTLPNIAEQVIIFIKDTDGELAEEHMGHKVGTRYMFKKESTFETHCIAR